MRSSSRPRTIWRNHAVGQSLVVLRKSQALTKSSMSTLSSVRLRSIHNHQLHLRFTSFKASYQITACKCDGPGSSNEIPTDPLLRWWDAYPVARSQAPPIPVEELAALMKNKASDFAVIDVRRNDHGVGCFKLFVVYNVRKTHLYHITPRAVMFEAATTGTRKHSTMIYLLSCKNIATQGKSCSIAVVQPGGGHGALGGTIRVGFLFGHIQG